MNSTVNNIKREQKKLRGCMKGYRKKLYGDARKNRKPYKFGWIANTHPDDDIGMRYSDYFLNGEKSFQREPTHVLGKSKDIDQRDIDLTNANTSSQMMPLQAQVEAFLKAPNIKLKKKSDDGNDHVKKDKVKNRFGKGRRLFVIGSGKIRSSEKTIQDIFRGEECVESYSSVSDSSDDEGSHGGSANAKTKERKLRTRRLRETQGGIIRGNSAYFKPILKSDSNKPLSPEINEDRANTPLAINNKKELADKTNVNDVFDEMTGNYDSLPSNCNNGNAKGPINELSLPIILPINHRGETADLMTTEKSFQPKNSDASGVSKRKADMSRKGISFGDIAKLQHGLKTKQLFSLVDQLASRHGIEDDTSIKDNSMEDPVAKSINKRALKKSAGDGNSSLTSYSSVFYAMKYGYGQGISGSHKESDLSSATTLRDKEDHSGSLSVTTGSRLGSERAQTLSTMFSHIDTHDNSLGRNFKVKGDGSFPARRAIDSDISDTFFSGVSRSIGQGSNEIGVQQTQDRESRYHRQRRRSSMLEVSHYVNSLRIKDGDKKMSFSRQMGLFDKRKDSAISSDDDELMPDIHKVTWSSALSRIKLVHTLADLKHII